MEIKRSVSDEFRLALTESIRKNKKSYFWAGLALTLTGILAILFPVFFSVSLAIFVGAALFFSGLFTAGAAFSFAGTGPFFGHLLLGLLKVAVGLIIFFNPFVGMVYLTSLVALIFTIQGAIEMSYAFELKPTKGWGWMFISSLLSIVCGVVIIASLATASIWVVGFIFGINFLSSGIAVMSISRNVGT